MTISLSLPHSWDGLTPAQLEAVSAILIDEARAYTQTGHFSRPSLLVRSFFAITGLHPVGLPRVDSTAPVSDGSPVGPSPDPYLLSTDQADPDTTYYNCEYTDLVLRNKYQSVPGHGIAPIRIYLGEIIALAIGQYTERDIRHYLKRMERYQRRIDAGKEAELPEEPEPQGPLSWLLKPSTRTIVPYPELTLTDPRHDDPTQHERYLDPETLRPAVRRYPATVTLAGPSELMQDFTWRQYRFACDYMTYLAQVENSLVEAQKRHQTARIQRLDREVHEVRAQFLATLFTRPVLHQDPETGQLAYAPHFLSSQTTDNAYLFADFPEERFQTVSLWWQGMMHYLSGRFPKVFRSNTVGKPTIGAENDPFALYTRSTTTMIKYAAANEEEVNHTTYTVILQHMQDMAEENDRIEAMKKN